MFSRIFSIMTNQTLVEYIRYRKFTLVAIELRKMNVKIIDIAMKFGYESSDSFGAAFKNFHGVTPTDVKNGKAFRIFSKVQIRI